VLFNELLHRRKRKSLPPTLDWWYFLGTMYWIYGGLINRRFESVIEAGGGWLAPLAARHTILSFSFFCIGFLAFVISLEHGLYKLQFMQFGWTVIVLLVVLVQGSAMISLIFEGIFWFFVSVSLVICNDIWAYLFGNLFGRTPLIKLSPKKTWEGFIGGTFATLLFGFLTAVWLSRYHFLVCPKERLLEWSVACTPDPMFVPTEVALPSFLASLLPFSSLSIPPVAFHCLVLAAFASLIAPFGGFFASGFKRALNIKDFGETIPGHGGLTDRMDCLFVMGVFANVYYSTFVTGKVDQSSVLASVLLLPSSGQLLLFERLREHLLASGMLANSTLI